MATAPPPARYGAILKARVRAAALPPSYTISGDTTELISPVRHSRGYVGTASPRCSGGRTP